MKKVSVFSALLALVLGLMFVSCDNGTTGGGDGIRKSGPGANLVDHLEFGFTGGSTEVYIYLKGEVWFRGGFSNRDFKFFIDGKENDHSGGYSYYDNELAFGVDRLRIENIGKKYTVKAVYTADPSRSLYVGRNTYQGSQLVGSFTIEQTVVYRW